MTISLPIASLRGHTLIQHSNGEISPDVRRASYEELAAHAAAGRIDLPVERIPLADVAAAWERQASSPNRKLVLVP